jgi:poly(3-hydroxybutyrate) depolymerase
MLVTAAATNQRRAAVIMLHGYTATPAGEEAVSGWTELMAGTDVLVAYPEGSATPYGGYGWSTGAARFATTGTNDVADINNVITELIREDCVNPREVVIAGESNGSGLGLILGCSSEVAPRVRLFALAIPAVDENVLKRCSGAAPFPLLVIASLHDATIIYDGKYPPGLAPFSAPLTWFEEIATGVDRCKGLREASVPDGQHYWYRSCAMPVNFYVADDGHHTWPGGPEGAGGLNPGIFPAAKLAWCASRPNATRFPVNCATIASAYGLQAPSSAIAPLSVP